MNIETCPECGVYCEPIDAEAFPKILLWKCPKCGAKEGGLSNGHLYQGDADAGERLYV